MTDHPLTVEQVAERYAVGKATVWGWIHSGELLALNVGRKPGAKKPRWRITAEAIERFELIRSSRPPAPPVRRRRKQTSEINYY